MSERAANDGLLDRLTIRVFGCEIAVRRSRHPAARFPLSRQSIAQTARWEVAGAGTGCTRINWRRQQMWLVKGV